MKAMASHSERDLLARGIRARCRGELRIDETLSEHTTFGAGGPADLFFLPADPEDLWEAIPLVRDAGLPVLPLGGGTNLLVRQAGFRGLVLCLTKAATAIRTEPGGAVAGAGASLQVLSRTCQRGGLGGLEFGGGIPGTVGGAIRGNAGAWGGETLDRLDWLRGIDVKSGAEVRLKKTQIPFGYRRAELPPELLVVEAAFGLEPEDPKAIKERMEQMLKARKGTQPLWKRNAGCIFKNPPGTSAGLLIDRARCKGLRAGNVEVSDVHANFMVNLGGGTAEEALSLIDLVQERVRRDAEVELELEIRIVGEQGVENV